LNIRYRSKAAGALGCDLDRKMWPPSYGWAIKRRAEIAAVNAAG